eukprot:TRINITY_DN12184_c2_g1_i6.p1 TRINITY_DN12184_c2_g1~~TRINITY_DN12184_c2_g1_i6.p1  ORF type:complete len:226 (-),score=17.18 TRINITY_DN12184_c2_g1_i6:215-892(-)
MKVRLLFATVCVFATVGMSQDSTQRCGSSWIRASESCGKDCPEGLDSECEEGQKCWSDLAMTPCRGETNQRCGVSWTSANSTCGQDCPNNSSDDCDTPGHDCWSDLSMAPCATPTDSKLEQWKWLLIAIGVAAALLLLVALIACACRGGKLPWLRKQDESMQTGLQRPSSSSGKPALESQGRQKTTMVESRSREYEAPRDDEELDKVLQLVAEQMNPGTGGPVMA